MWNCFFFFQVDFDILHWAGSGNKSEERSPVHILHQAKIGSQKLPEKWQRVVHIFIYNNLYFFHAMNLIVHILMNVNKLLKPQTQVVLIIMKIDSRGPQKKTQVSFIMMKTDSRGPRRKTHVVLIMMKRDPRSPQSTQTSR